MEKQGPVLITFKHTGESEALKVTTVLEKRGIKKGDLVALEISDLQQENLVGYYLRKNFGSLVELPDDTIKNDPHAIFLVKVFDFLLRKDVMILPFAPAGAAQLKIINRIETSWAG